MMMERIDECKVCPGRLEKKGQYWICRNCGAIYSMGKHFDGTEFASPVAPPKDLPCGQIAERAAQISVDKITVKDIKPPKEIESDVYRESKDLDYHESVNLITVYLKKGEWDEAQDKVYKLRNLNDPCSTSAAIWYGMACDRKAHDDLELVRSFANVSEAELSKLDSIFPSAMPDFRKRILNLIIDFGYVGDESTVKLFSTILPYVFNEMIYSNEERKDKVEFMFDEVISQKYSQTFKYLLTHTLSSADVDLYINYLDRFANRCSPLVAQEYLSMILSANPGNISAHRRLIESEIKSNSSADKCIADFERMIKYSQDPKSDVEHFITILINEETTTEAKADFMWSLLSYYHEDEIAQKQAMSQYAELLLQSKMWEKASSFYSAVLIKDPQDATVYFNLCLADMRARNGSELITKDVSFTEHPYYNKALALASKTDKDFAKYLSNLIDSRKKRVSNAQAEKAKKKKLISTIVIGLVAILTIVIALIITNGIRQKKCYSSDNIIITILDKVEAPEQSSYHNGYITAFKVNVKNNSILDIERIQGDLKVYNAADKLLVTSDCKLTGDLTAGGECTFVLNVDNRESEEAVEFFYADCDDLKVTLKLTKIIYEGNDIKEYDEEPIIILELSNESDGVSSSETTYQEAVTLYNQGNYLEAKPLFESLGSYKDSKDYYNQCNKQVENASNDSIYNNAMSLYNQEKYGEAIEALRGIYSYKDSADKIEEIIGTVETKAEALAAISDYSGACSLLEQLGYNERNNDTYKAYAFAREGDFVTAVQNGLKILSLPEGTESIPDNYLKDSNHRYDLERVVLPSSLKSIGSSAFAGCINLVEVNLPNGLTSISSSAFSGCSSLSSIVLPEGLTEIGKSAFAYCSKLSDIQWSSTIQIIGESAFKGCDSLTTLKLPNSVVNLGNSAFAECDALTNVCIPSSVKKIGGQAFEYCSVLTDVTISDGTEVIGSYAFNQCTKLTNVSLPNSLKEIEENAFYQCSALVEITIPGQVTKIGKYVFLGCTSLQKVHFSKTDGWTKDGVFDVDVSNAQKNAQALVKDNAGSWKRS